MFASLLVSGLRPYHQLMVPDSTTPRKSTSAPRLQAIVLGSGDRPNVAAKADPIRQVIEQYADIVLWDMEFEHELNDLEADLVIVLGGDGSILRAVGRMGYRQLPLIGVNLGKLGFLADLTPDELHAVLPNIQERKHSVVDHLMFECRLLRDGKVIAEHLGLNETVIRAGSPFSILDVNLYVDSKLVTTYSCDGLIISTPVGSTAHSLSAGGPILRKSLQAFVISPISPHTLTIRPVVDSADREYRLEIASPEGSAAVVVDGRVLGTMQPGDQVSVVKAPTSFKLIDVEGHNYYRTLREKLGWGGRVISQDAT